MILNLIPTKLFSQIQPAVRGDLPYARLWIGTMEDEQGNTSVVQALIFGVAVLGAEPLSQADVEHCAMDLPEGTVSLFPDKITAPREPGTYRPPES